MGPNRRRQLLAITGAIVSPRLVWSQSPSEFRRLGFFANAPTPAPDDHVRLAFRSLWIAKLASLGWIKGKNFELDSLYSGGDEARLPELVAELIRRHVDAIWVTSTAAAIAAARGTKTVPIVLAGASAYPIECGLIKSYARPGTNVTGVAWFQGIEVHSKLVQFLKEIVPAARRLAWMVFPADLVTVSGSQFSPKPYYANVTQSAGLDFAYYECPTARDIEPTFAAIRHWGAHAVIVEPALLSFVEAQTIARLALQARLPSLSGIAAIVERGGLLGYSPVLNELQEQAMTYVDRIFRGAVAADLPVAMPNKLELLVNLQTARALGLTIPQSILLRADRVIE